MYKVKEIFYTLQGEGVFTGRPAVFCRFSGCNLWTGHERNRNRAICNFCDTDFVGVDGTGGGRYSTAENLAVAVAGVWGSQNLDLSFVVLTGGEPLLQVDSELLNALHSYGFTIAVETNGTRVTPDGIDWLCVSPKADSTLVLTSGNELKLVFPQEKATPKMFEHLKFDRFSLQPMDGVDVEMNTKAAIKYCLEHPKWTLSLQTHKFLGLR